MRSKDLVMSHWRKHFQTRFPNCFVPLSCLQFSTLTGREHQRTHTCTLFRLMFRSSFHHEGRHSSTCQMWFSLRSSAPTTTTTTPPHPPKPLHAENGSFPSLLSLSWIFSFFLPRGTTNCVQIFTHSNLVFWAIWNSNNYKQTRIIPPSPLMDLSRGDKKIKHFSFLPRVIFERRLIF